MKTAISSEDWEELTESAMFEALVRVFHERFSKLFDEALNKQAFWEKMNEYLKGNDETKTT